MRREKVKPSFFLHCDECHHEVDFQGKMGRQHIGFPCPACGADMLTEKDYKVGRRIQWLMSFFCFLGLMRRGGREHIQPGETAIRVHHHNGRTSVTEL